MKFTMALLVTLSSLIANADSLRASSIQAMSNPDSSGKVCGLESSTQKKHLTPEALEKQTWQYWEDDKYTQERVYVSSYNPNKGEIGLSEVWDNCGSCIDGSKYYHGLSEIQPYTVRGSATCQEKYVDLLFYNTGLYHVDEPAWDDTKWNVTELQNIFNPHAQEVCDQLNKSAPGASRVTYKTTSTPNGYYKEHFYSFKKPKNLIRLEARCFIVE